MVLASERMGAHERPVDIGRYCLGQESCEVDFARIAEHLCDLTFIRIFGGGYSLICRAVPCGRWSCEGGRNCGSDRKVLERIMHCAVGQWDDGDRWAVGSN